MSRQGNDIVELGDQIRRAEYAIDVDAVAEAIVARISVPSDVMLEARELAGGCAIEPEA
jgi:hypothetical protein